MRQFGLVIAALGLAAAPLAAQNHPECAGGSLPQAREACDMAVDAARVTHPLIGMVVSGGNPVIGTGGTQGGFGHGSVTGRVNAVRVDFPDVSSAGLTSVPSSFDGYLPAPVIEASTGVFRGLSSGLLSVDALGSALLLPTTGVDRFTVEPGAASIGNVALGIGYGVRVGLVRGGPLVPSVSASVMRRHLPRVRYGDVDTGDPIEFSTNLRATNVRVTAGLSLTMLELAAGLGIDTYTSDARIRYEDFGTTRLVALDLDNTRQVLFLDAGLSLGLARLVAELGYQTGKDQDLSTNFSDFDPTAGHVFWSAGVRLGF